MLVHKSGAHSVAVYIETRELEHYVGEGQELGEPQARELAINAMRELGLAVTGALEIEAFTGAAGAMVFALLNPQEEEAAAFFSFDSIDGALDAMLMLRDTRSRCEARLFMPDGWPILALRGTQSAVGYISNLLCEFGYRRNHPPEYQLFLHEHSVLS